MHIFSVSQSIFWIQDLSSFIVGGAEASSLHLTHAYADYWNTNYLWIAQIMLKTRFSVRTEKIYAAHTSFNTVKLKHSTGETRETHFWLEKNFRGNKYNSTWVWLDLILASCLTGAATAPPHPWSNSSLCGKLWP